MWPSFRERRAPEETRAEEGESGRATEEARQGAETWTMENRGVCAGGWGEETESLALA